MGLQNLSGAQAHVEKIRENKPCVYLDVFKGMDKSREKIMKLCMVVGARPNFMKTAPILRELKSNDRLRIDYCLVHTGQHYDYEMSQSFFHDLGIPQPHYFLNAGSGTHSEQTASIMKSFEKVCEKEKPDVVMVVGDVNSTLACSIVAKKMNLKVAHVEAGLRSFDMSMPEEINRIVTDSISDFFFVTEKKAIQNLIAEGKDASRIYFVGNVMVDNLFFQLERLKANNFIFNSSSLKDRLGDYIFLTLHRPSNVDNGQILNELFTAFNEISLEIPIIFPAHPRTAKMIEIFGIELSGNIHILPPLSFNESLNLWKDAVCVFTDSGGLQEETTALGIPCFTLRKNTERPVTVDEGTNLVVGNSYYAIISAYEEFKKGKIKKGQTPQLWDGKAAKRILEIFNNDIIADG